MAQNNLQKTFEKKLLNINVTEMKAEELFHFRNKSIMFWGINSWYKYGYHPILRDEVSRCCM